MNGHALRELAQSWATVAHDGQCRRGAGEPYINHCSRVADRVWGWRPKALAWLHDTIEDAASPSRMEIALRVMFPADLVDDVRLLSRLPDEDGTKEVYASWIVRLKKSGNQDVIIVKIADLEDNLSDITDIPNGQSQRARYSSALGVLLA